MKKIILVIAAVALLASPAMAVDWNFYGSARMQTFYVTRDYNNAEFSDMDGGGLSNKASKDSDDSIRWDQQTNSRLGARVKAENVSGRFEFGIDPGNVWSRLIYGTWDFGAATLKVGKDYGPVTQFVSGQAFAEDNGLLGQGAAYGSRRGQVALSFGGFEIAAIETAGGTIDNISTGDKDNYLPKMEAAFSMAFDTWNFRVLGGYQYYEIEDAGQNANKDVDVDSYIIGGDVGFNFGPAYVKAAGTWGQNWNEAAWFIGGFTGEGGDILFGAPDASFTGKSSTDDVEAYQACMIVGFKFTDQLTFEGGFGYWGVDPDANDQDDSFGTTGYVQAVISMAPGVWLLPEVGYQSYLADYDGTGKAAGQQVYFGAKWQIDF